MKKKQEQKTDCVDTRCPLHGKLSTRGRTFVGVVTSSKCHRTCTVTWGTKKKIKTYERSKKVRTKIKVHNPDCINAKKGDKVRIVECRPLSKTKRFAVVEKLGHEIAHEKDYGNIKTKKEKLNLLKQEEEKEGQAQDKKGEGKN